MTKLTDKSADFYNKWVGEIPFINSSMRSIRKLQSDSNLLNLCYTNKDAMDKHYDGFLFDKMKRSDGLYQFVVYLPELKMSSRITLCNDFDNYVCKKFKLFLNYSFKVRLLSFKKTCYSALVKKKTVLPRDGVFFRALSTRQLFF